MREYKTRSSEEAKFVYALDKLMPVILNYVNEGHSWRLHNITLDQVHAVKKEKMKIFPAVHEYYEELYELLLQHPEYFPDEPRATHRA
jgi:putative hydrolase of HD superfamily